VLSAPVIEYIPGLSFRLKSEQEALGTVAILVLSNPFEIFSIHSLLPTTGDSDLTAFCNNMTSLLHH